MLQLKNTILIITILASFFACGKNDDQSLRIKGKLSNLDAKHFYIAIDNPSSIDVDTIFVDKNGSFTFKKDIDKLTMASLYFENQSWPISIFLNKGWSIEIEGNIENPDLIKVTGGDVNDDLTSFKKKNSDLLKSRSELLKKISQTQSAETSQVYSAELKNINFDLTNKAKEYIESNPDKIASVVLMQDFYKNNISTEVLEEMISKLKGDALSFPLTSDLKRYCERAKRSEAGAIAPDFSFKDKNNRTVTKESFKNKYLYITFAAQKGEIYEKSIPAMIQEYNVLKKDNIEFVSVYVDYETTNTPDSIKWSVIYEPKGWASEAVKAYNITELPYSILISPEGYIIERGIPVVSLATKIKK